MAFGRLLLAWAVVAAWLVAWDAVQGRVTGGPAPRPRELWVPAGEAALLALFGALWFGSLGAGAWWLVFLLVGTLREWPVRTTTGAARIARVVAAGGLLAWVLPS